MFMKVVKGDKGVWEGEQDGAHTAWDGMSSFAGASCSSSECECVSVCVCTAPAPSSEPSLARHVCIRIHKGHGLVQISSL